MDHLLTGLLKCLLIAIVGNIITTPCFAQPLNANITKVAKLGNSQENSKPLILTKDTSPTSDLEFPITNIVEDHQDSSAQNANQNQQDQLNTDADKHSTDFPDRRGFFTGHRIPLELFGEETLRHIELIGDKETKENQALPRVPPGYPRRIPLELFSEESLRRIDGLEDEEDEKTENFPRPIPLELFTDESLTRLDLLDEKEQDANEEKQGKTTVIPAKVKSYVDSDAIRASNDNDDQLNRTPKRLYIHGGINDDPEAAAHHFPGLSLGGEGDPAFLDTLLSFYNE